MESDLLKVMSEAKEAYQLHLVSLFSQDKSNLFKHLRTLKSRPSIPDTVYFNGSSESDPVKKCNLFNLFFNSTFSDPTLQPSHIDHLISTSFGGSNTLFSSLDISEADVYLLWIHIKHLAQMVLALRY